MKGMRVVERDGKLVAEEFESDHVPPTDLPPPIPRVLSKELIIDRMNNAELATFITDRDAWTQRQREKFNSLTQVVEGTPVWTVLATKLEAKFGRARALEILADV